MNEQKEIALVTGGAGGIGGAISRSLAAAGYIVGIHYRSRQDAADCLVKELVDNGERAFSISGDLSSISGCDEVYNVLQKRSDPLGVLVNNAGVVSDNPIFSAGVEEFESTVDLNLRGTWYLSKRLSRLMMRRKRGRIINISSVSGSIGNPTQSIYGMTKAGIDSFTKVAAAEFAEYGIGVVGVAPGFIDTEMTARLAPEIREHILGQIPLGRMGSPEEIADVVRFLAVSGTYITGTTIHVNGGLYAG